MFRLVAAGVAATSVGVMIGMAVIAIIGEPPYQPLPAPPVTVSLSVAKPSGPPNSSSTARTEAMPERRTIVAAPRVPLPPAPPAQPTAPKPAPPLSVLGPSASPGPSAASSQRASPAPMAPPARLPQQSEDDDDDDEDDC